MLRKPQNIVWFFIGVGIVLFLTFMCTLANAQNIPLPDTGAYGKIQGGDETHVNEVIYTIPYEIRGNYILTYEVWDADVADEIKIFLNDKEIATVPIIGNEIWSPTQTLKIKDILLCDDNLQNTIKFDAMPNPPATNWWGVRNVQLIKDKTMNDLTLYQIDTDKDVTIGWDDTNTDLEGEIYHFFLWNEGEEKKYLIGETQQLQVTIKVPRTGLWIFYARACLSTVSDPPKENECSQWAHSALEQEDGTAFGKVDDPTNPGTQINKKWMIYGNIAAPSGGGVE